MRGEKKKQSLYFPEEVLAEIQYEADRQDRSLSWIVQQAWRIARAELQKLPGAPATQAEGFARGKFDRG
jgi:uncharacterized small protein (TIGR04563 family)